ncbi:MAG: tRNA-intron lyase [Thermoprotei archaeon]|nr:MAG: tRNA-intron lyase [Thermoprotei archaeon]
MVLLEELRVKAQLVDGRVVVWDVKQAAKLYKEGFYGKFVGVSKPKDQMPERPLELSLLEAYYLAEKGRITIVDQAGNEVSLKDFYEYAKKFYEDFEYRYKVYKDLRERGYVVRPGMKFGSMYAVYKYGPGIDHAPFLVHVMPMERSMDPVEIIRAGRLSHSVKKRFIIASVNPKTGSVDYCIFSWFKP